MKWINSAFFVFIDCMKKIKVRVTKNKCFQWIGQINGGGREKINFNIRKWNNNRENRKRKRNERKKES